MKYNKLGKLPIETVNFFLTEILKRKKPDIPYQWIQFDDYLHNEFLKIFTNTELTIQQAVDKSRPIQKAFYSEPGYGFRIHKDGVKCQSALNIAISCNLDDWVRWYDEDYINSITSMASKTYLLNNTYVASRDTDMEDYENIPFVEEVRNEIGDVYVLDVDAYHSFKCIGENPRIIIQTKFENYPNLSTIYESLKNNSFNNLISHVN
jgi:hypothetical protein